MNGSTLPAAPIHQRLLSLLLEKPWVLLLLGLSLVGSAVFMVGHVSHLTSEIFKELGMAVSIIGFVTWSVETARIKTFTDTLSKVVSNKLEEIKQTTVDAIIQGSLPRDYYEHISKTMFLSAFVQFDWNIIVEFHWTSAEREYLHVVIDQTYKVQNISSVPETYHLHHFESRDWDDKFPNSTSFRYIEAYFEGVVDPIVHEVNTPSAEKPWKTEGDYLSYGRDVEIPSAGVLLVRVGSRKIMRDRQYESRLVVHPTLGAEFTLQGPGDLHTDVEIPDILLGSLAGKTKIGEEEDDLLGRNVSHWKIARPLPPATSVFVNWRRVQKPT